MAAPFLYARYWMVPDPAVKLLIKKTVSAVWDPREADALRFRDRSPREDTYGGRA